MDLKEKTAKWPLEVVYPFGGRFYGLLHSTYSDGNYLLLAKSQEQLVVMFKSLLESDRAPEKLKRYYVGNFVKPPRWLEEAYAEAEYKSAVESAVDQVRYAAQSYLDYHGTYPPGTKGCLKYQFEEPCSPEENKARETDDVEHYNCVCRGKIRLTTSLSPEQIYERVAHVLEADRRKQASSVYRARAINRWVPSQAPEPVPGMPIYGITANHGHHTHGNIVEILNPDNFSSQYRFRSFLAYFQGEVSDIVPEFLQALHREQLAAWKKEKEDDERSRKEEMERGDKERADQALVLLELLK